MRLISKEFAEIPLTCKKQSILIIAYDIQSWVPQWKAYLLPEPDFFKTKQNKPKNKKIPKKKLIEHGVTDLFWHLEYSHSWHMTFEKIYQRDIGLV